MVDAADMVKDLLVTAGVGLEGPGTGWRIFVSQEPEKAGSGATGVPDTVITTYNSGGLPPNPKWLLDYPSVQVRIRGAVGGYLASRSKAQEVKDALLGIPSQDVGADRLVAINGEGDILDIAQDDNRRPLHTVNFTMIIEPATGTNRIPL